MAVTLTLPLWLAIVLGLLALWSALDRLLIPSARWFLRRRVNRVLEEINTRLKIRIPPFKLTKREVLIDRLLYDPQVQEAAEAEARESGMPREVVQERVAPLRAGDRPGLQRVRLLPRRLLARPEHRALALPRAARLLRRGGARARSPRNATVVFLINHRSNMDYILVSYLAAEKSRALLRGRRVGADLAAPDAHPGDGGVLRPPQLEGPALPQGARALRRDGDGRRA